MSITRPTNLTVPFANAGAKNTIPVADAAPLASFTLGFPPVTMLPIIAGGEAPDGKDFNGILYDITTHTMWVNAGGQYLFDAALSTAIGGYPVGMVLQSNDGLSAYVSAVAANTTDFNSSPGSIGTSWMPWAGAALRNAAIIWCGTSGGAANVQTFTPTPPVTTLVAGQTFSGIAGFTNTASLTVNISGIGPITVKRDSPAGPIPLTGGEWVAGNIVSMKFDGTYLQLTDTDLGQLALLNIGNGLESDGAGNLRVKPSNGSIRQSSTGIESANPLSSVGSGTHAIIATDNGAAFIITATESFTCLAASSYFNGFTVRVTARDATAIWTPNGTDTVNAGAAGAAYTIIKGSSLDMICDGVSNWQPIAVTNAPGAYAPAYVNANVTVVAGQYLADTSGGAFTITLTSSPNDGDSVRFIDAYFTWCTKNLTINPNGKTVELSSANMICDTRMVSDFTLIYKASTGNWSIQ